jgi:hypothetical protein
MNSPQPSPLEATLLATFTRIEAFRHRTECMYDDTRYLPQAGMLIFDLSSKLDSTTGYLDLVGNYREGHGACGLLVLVGIKDHRLHQIEIAVYGNDLGMARNATGKLPDGNISPDRNFRYGPQPPGAPPAGHPPSAARPVRPLSSRLSRGDAHNLNLRHNRSD